MAHTRVLHEERGFHMSKSYAEQVMREHCTITWVIPGQTIRDTTDEERIAMRAEQVNQERLRAPLEYAELPGFNVKDITLYPHLVRAAHEFVTSRAA